MKKQILLIIVLFVMLGASAQTAIGLKAGLNGSSISSTEEKYESVLRTNVGFMCNFTYTKPVSFQMEINYSRKGGKNSLTDNKLTYGYLEIPLLLKFAGGNDKFKVFGLAGPYIGVPMKEELIIGDKKTVFNTTENGVDGNPVIEKMDVGFHLGAGITYKLGPGRILLEIRYCQGYGENFIEDSFNTRVFAVSTGYVFTFGD